MSSILLIYEVVAIKHNLQKSDTHEVSSNWIFYLIILNLLIQKDTIATLRIVKIEESEMNFLLMLYFDA